VLEVPVQQGARQPGPAGAVALYMAAGLGSPPRGDQLHQVLISESRPSRASTEGEFVTNMSCAGFCNRCFAHCSCLDIGCVLCATSELGKMVSATVV
jgi:hypothetical protein